MPNQDLENCVRFTNTSGQRIRMGDNLDLDGLGAWSWSFWTQVNNFTSADGFISKRAGAALFTGYLIWLNSTATDGSLEVIIRGNVNVNNRIEVRTTYPLLKINTWHHVVMTYSGSGTAAGIKFYIDTLLATQITDADTYDGTSISNTANLDFGWDSLNASNVLNGSMTGVALFDGIELTQDQVTAVYKGDYSLATNHWGFTEGTGTTVADDIGGIDGTIAGTAAWTTRGPLVPRTTVTTNRTSVS